MASTPAAGRFFSAFYSWGHAGRRQLYNGKRQLSPQTRQLGSYRPESRARTTSPCKYTRRPSFRSTATSTKVLNPYNSQKTAPEIDHPPSNSLSDHLRLLMRHIPHPVVLITATNPSPSAGTPAENDSPYRGSTISSFTTVTLDPTPKVSFNIRVPSRTYSALAASGAFAVHVLAANAEGARIAHAFTRGQAEKAFVELAGDSGIEIGVLKGLRSGIEGPPVIASPGVLKVLRCRIDGPGLQAGDHVIVVGEVVGLLEDPARKGAAITGLGYADRAYRALGTPIDVEEDENIEN